MYQKIFIIGHVGRDAELRYTPTGIAVTDFSVATNRTIGKGQDRKTFTTWWKVIVWREQAEIAAQYVRKGMLIMVEGSAIEATAYMDGKNQKLMGKLELTASLFKFLSKADAQAVQQAAEPVARPEEPGESTEEEEEETPDDQSADSGGDIPF